MSLRRRRPLAVTVFTMILTVATVWTLGGGRASPALAAAAETVRVSVAANGAQVYTGFPGSLAISGDGTAVAFESGDTTLVAGDTNGVGDIFVKDLTTGAIDRVSLDSAGGQADGRSEQPSISEDGRYVAFTSFATNLVANDTNQVSDVFVHDRDTGTTTRVNVSAFGREADGNSVMASISPDGGSVVFASAAENLTGGSEPPNGYLDVFLKRINGSVTKVSQPPSGTANGPSKNPVVSRDGTYVAFRTGATNLLSSGVPLATTPNIVLWESTGTITLASRNTAGTKSGSTEDRPALSADGRYIAFTSDQRLVSGDANGHVDVFVHDRVTHATIRASEGPSGVEADDRSDHASISPDGRYVAFDSRATNLVPRDTNGDTDVFVRDLVAGTTDRVSVRTGGAEVRGHSRRPSVSDAGSRVAFSSDSGGLVAGDINNTSDIFVRGTGIVAATPAPPVPAALSCGWGSYRIICELTYGGGPSPVVRWFRDGRAEPGSNDQTVASFTCQATTAVRVEVVDADVPTAAITWVGPCFANPP
jgi:Tol biopolymer transport system component